MAGNLFITIQSNVLTTCVGMHVVSFKNKWNMSPPRHSFPQLAWGITQPFVENSYTVQGISIWICYKNTFIFCNISQWLWGKWLKSFFLDYNKLPTFHSQYDSCWCPDNPRSQGINSNDIELVLLHYFMVLYGKHYMSQNVDKVNIICQTFNLQPHPPQMSRQLCVVFAWRSEGCKSMVISNMHPVIISIHWLSTGWPICLVVHNKKVTRHLRELQHPQLELLKFQHCIKLDESTARRQLKSPQPLSGRSIHLTLVTKWSWSWMTYCHPLCKMSIGPPILRNS